jgi:outer membrane lipoprotein carrier protein
MKMLRKTLCAMTVGVVTLGPVMSSTVFAAPVAASEQQATTSLVKQLSGIQSISSNFEQTTKVTNSSKAPKKQGLSAQHMNQTFKGVMKVERPGKFYWETTSPAKQTIVTSGKTVWIYDPDLQQAVRQTLDEQVANTLHYYCQGIRNRFVSHTVLRNQIRAKPTIPCTQKAMMVHFKA